DPPEGVVGGVQVLLERAPGAAAAVPVAVARDRVVERRVRAPDDDGDPAAEAFEVDREAPAVDLADPAVPEIFEVEDVGEELAGEAPGDRMGIVSRLRARRRELAPERLGDPPVARDLAAEPEPLLDPVVRSEARRARSGCASPGA